MNYVLIFLIIVFLNNSAYAYLDPGTGSVILQLVLSSIATGVAFLAIYYNKFKIFLKKIFTKKKDNQNKTEK